MKVMSRLHSLLLLPHSGALSRIVSFLPSSAIQSLCFISPPPPSTLSLASSSSSSLANHGHSRMATRKLSSRTFSMNEQDLRIEIGGRDLTAEAAAVGDDNVISSGAPGDDDVSDGETGEGTMKKKKKSIFGFEGSKERSRLRLVSTGGLKDLPVAAPAVELLARALRKSKKVTQDQDIKNARARAKKWSAQRMDTMAKEISKPLKYIIESYKHQLPILHPFEATLADLTVRARVKSGGRTLESVLENVNELRKEALIIGRGNAQLANTKTSKLDALQVMDDGYQQIEELFNEKGYVINELIEVQKALRSLPIVKLDIPTVVLVGAPNVGKSTIVRAISSGTPEVNNYPFTTRGMTLGHMFDTITAERYQCMDTPGLLSRPDEKRNEMEALTLASMQHLPTAVIFVLDLTGTSGEQSSLEKQLAIRNELRSRFPKRPWVDVISKSDLPMAEGAEDVMAALRETEGYMLLSVDEGVGVEELKDRVMSMLQVLKEVLFRNAASLEALRRTQE